MRWFHFVKPGHAQYTIGCRITDHKTALTDGKAIIQCGVNISFKLLIKTFIDKEGFRILPDPLILRQLM